MPCVTTLAPSYIKNSLVITFCIRRTIEVVANTMLGMMDIELAADLIIIVLLKFGVASPLASVRFYRLGCVMNQCWYDFIIVDFVMQLTPAGGMCSCTLLH